MRDTLLRLVELREVAEHNARDHGGVQVMSTREVLALIDIAERASELTRFIGQGGNANQRNVVARVDAALEKLT